MRVVVVSLFLVFRAELCRGQGPTWETLKKECEDQDPLIADTLLCLTTLGETGVVSLVRDNITEPDPSGTGILAQIRPSLSMDTEVTLIGANPAQYSWVSFAIADVARGSMSKGGPVLVCMSHQNDLVARVYFLGTQSGGLQLSPFQVIKQKLAALTADDFFKDLQVTEETFQGEKVIICKFKVTKRVWKLDGTEFDLLTSPYNIAMAHGRVEDRFHIMGDLDSLLPASHVPTSRFVSTAKYFLHQAAVPRGQPHIGEYLPCGITDYCVGAGFDGCGSSSFDCKFFAKFTRKSATTLHVSLRGTTFMSFFGVGFSSSPILLPGAGEMRWSELQFLAVCEVGSPISILRVNCSTGNECVTSNGAPGQPGIVPIDLPNLSMVVNSNDESVELITCSFDLEFTGDDLEMMKKAGTRLLMGGDGKGLTEWLKLIQTYPVDDQFVYLSAIANDPLLSEDGKPLMPLGGWQLVKQASSPFKDPADLDPVDPNCGSRLWSQLFIILTTTIILQFNTLCSAS